MKTKNEELDVDYIQSRPLTKKEEKELSEFIKKLKDQKAKPSKNLRYVIFQLPVTGEKKNKNPYLQTNMKYEKYQLESDKKLLVFGLKDDQWHAFRKDTEYNAFLIKRKIRKLVLS